MQWSPCAAMSTSPAAVSGVDVYSPSDAECPVGFVAIVLKPVTDIYSPLSLCPLVRDCLRTIISLLPPPKISRGEQWWTSTLVVSRVQAQGHPSQLELECCSVFLHPPFLRLQPALPLVCGVCAGASAGLVQEAQLEAFPFVPSCPQPFGRGGCPHQVPELRASWVLSVGRGSYASASVGAVHLHCCSRAVPLPQLSCFQQDLYLGSLCRPVSLHASAFTATR